MPLPYRERSAASNDVSALKHHELPDKERRQQRLSSEKLNENFYNDIFKHMMED